METGAITNGQITASSEWDSSYAVTFGRLFNQQNSGGWVSSTADANQWMRIDLSEQQTRITRVATQGRFDFANWVTKYKLQYSNDGMAFQYYREEGQNNEKVKKKSNYQHSTLPFTIVL